MKFRLVENFDGYKKGDKVELSNGQTGTVEADYNLHDDRIKVLIDGMDEIKFPLVDTVRPIHKESFKEKFNTNIDFPYMFFYNCNNPTFGYDFQLLASSLGARKVYGKYKGNGAGSYFYLVPSEEVYNKLKAVAKDKYTVDMQKLLPYDAESYPNFQYVKESLKETLDMSLEELQRTADRYLDIEIDELMRTILNKTSNMTRDQLSRLVRLCRNFYALLEEFASNTITESFYNNFESRDLQDTGELISALKALVKEYGHMELEKEVYLETVENDHGRQLKIVYQQINEDTDPELNKKRANIRQQALEYVLDRLSDFYMSEYDQEERIKHANNIVDMIVRIYPEMIDYVQYWGGGEYVADNLCDEGVREDVTDEIRDNFPESVITDYLCAKKIIRDD